MSGPIRDVTDQFFRLTQKLEDCLDDVDVASLSLAADVVNRAWTTLLEGQDQSLAVIVHVEPVAHVESVSVDRQWLISQRIDDHQRDQLFGKLIAAIGV